MSSSSHATRCECRQLASYDSSVDPQELFVDIVALSEQVSRDEDTLLHLCYKAETLTSIPSQVLGGFLSVLRNGRGWTKADIVTNAFVFITIGEHRLSVEPHKSIHSCITNIH